MPSHRILIIEDNRQLCEIFQMSFEDADFEVKVSYNGLNGAVDIVEFKPDAILLDIMMPQMSGYEVLQAIRNNTSMQVPIIVCSNLSQQADIDKAFRLGADYYVRKSDYDATELADKVVELIKELEEK